MSIPSKPESELSCQPGRGDNPRFTIVKNQRQARINDGDFEQLGGGLSLPKVKLREFSPKKDLSLEISENKACPAYIGTVIEGVKISPSPLWLQQRLQAAGWRSLNNLVDITNYVLSLTNSP